MHESKHLLLVGIVSALLSACSGMASKDTAAAPAATPEATAPASASVETTSFVTAELAEFSAPWAMTVLPDGRLLVTEMAGALKLYDPAQNRTGEISGVPGVVHVAQGGLGDVVRHPVFASNQTTRSPTRVAWQRSTREGKGWLLKITPQTTG